MAEKKEFNQNKYVIEYKKNKYDSISTLAPKGTKDKLKDLAKAEGISVNELVNRIIKSYIDK